MIHGICQVVVWGLLLLGICIVSSLLHQWWWLIFPSPVMVDKCWQAWRFAFGFLGPILFMWTVSVAFLCQTCLDVLVKTCDSEKKNIVILIWKSNQGDPFASGWKHPLGIHSRGICQCVPKQKLGFSFWSVDSRGHCMPGVSPDSPPSPAAGDAETQAYFERRLSWLGPWGYEWTMKFKQGDVQLKSDQTKGTSIVLHHILFLNREQCVFVFLSGWCLSLQVKAETSFGQPCQVESWSHWLNGSFTGLELLSISYCFIFHNHATCPGERVIQMDSVDWIHMSTVSSRPAYASLL